ncbi:MAG: hypothetical protein U5L07_10115 [Desulfobacterales bacterium]|nr:hypothetical protein [Desulfobacterales bacterium]
MAKKKKKKHKPEKHAGYFIDPEDVLANRVSVSIHDLADLIHQVNPTGETLAAAESRERYQLKTRLQSYLVRCFPDHLEVIQPDPRNPDLVSFYILYSGRDACHALISELEEDARSWALRYIDEDDGAPAANESGKIAVVPEAPGPDDSKAGAGDADISEWSVEALMAQGKNALDQFDYDTVGTCFRQALEKSGGDVTPAIAITEFYVDYVAAYDAALEVTRMFGAPARKNKEIKSLLALAAARSGRIELALDYADGLTQPRNIEVYLSAARHYLENQDPDRAEQMLGRARAFDPAGIHAEIDSLQAEIHQQYAQMLESEAQKMMQAWDAGEIDAAVQLADQIRRVLPQHETARRIRREYDRLQRQNRFDELMQQADLARDNRDFKREAEYIRKALKINKNAENLYSRLDQAIKNDEAQRNARAVADVEVPWKAGDEKTAFLRYLEANARQRQCVRTEFADGRLEWLEQIRTAGPPVKPNEMVDAVFCLQQAFADFETGGDPAGISKSLAAYTKTLQPVEAARKLMIDLERQARTIEWQRNKERLNRIESALPAMDVDSAKDLFSRIRSGQLSEDDYHRYEKIQARLQQMENHQILERRYADAVSKGDDFLARNTADQIARIDDPENEGGWQDRIQWHTAEIHRKWRLREVDMERVPLFYAAFGFSTSEIDKPFKMSPDGRHLLMITLHGRSGFLRWYDIASRKFTSGWLFQTPRPMDFPKIQLQDNTLMISDLFGRVLEIELDPFLIRGWYDFGGMLRSTDVCEDTWIFPRSRRFWMDVREQSDAPAESINIYALEDFRKCRTIKLTSTVGVQLNTGWDNYVGMQDERRKLIRMYNEYGKFSFVINQRVSGPCDQMAIHPDGHRFILLSFRDEFFESDPDDPVDLEDYELCLEIQSPDTASAAWNPVMQIKDSNGEAPHEMLTSLNEKLVFIYFHDDRGRQLMCLHPRENTFDILYQIPLPSNICLVTDAFIERVAAVQYTKERFGVQVLGRQRPVFETDREETIDINRMPRFNTFGLTCGVPGGRIETMAEQYIREVEESPHGVLIHHLARLKKNGSPDDLAAYGLALHYVPGLSGFKLSLDLSNWMAEHYPDYYRSRIHNANSAVKNADWQQVMALLEPIPRYDLDDEPSARHICHLLGIAYLGAEMLEQALDVWREGTGYTGDCDLSDHIEYAEFAIDYRDSAKPVPNGDVARAAGRLFQLYETVNHYRRVGDWIAVIDAIESEGGQVQVLRDNRLMARLAEAYLNLPDESADNRILGKPLILSVFCTKDLKQEGNVILPPFIETPSNEEMAELAKRAAAAVN